MGNNVAPYSESSTIGNNFSQNDMFLHVITSQCKAIKPRQITEHLTRTNSQELLSFVNTNNSKKAILVKKNTLYKSIKERG